MKSTLISGSLCTFATIAISEWNQWIGFAVGLASLAAFIPLAITRWQKFLARKPVETKDPFLNE